MTSEDASVVRTEWLRRESQEIKSEVMVGQITKWFQGPNEDLDF